MEAKEAAFGITGGGSSRAKNDSDLLSASESEGGALSDGLRNWSGSEDDLLSSDEEKEMDSDSDSDDEYWAQFEREAEQLKGT